MEILTMEEFDTIMDAIDIIDLVEDIEDDITGVSLEELCQFA